MLYMALGALAVLLASMIVMLYWKCWRIETTLFKQRKVPIP